MFQSFTYRRHISSRPRSGPMSALPPPKRHSARTAIPLRGERRSTRWTTSKCDCFHPVHGTIAVTYRANGRSRGTSALGGAVEDTWTSPVLACSMKGNASR